MIAPGFEPGTVCLEGRCSIQLSYATWCFLQISNFTYSQCDGSLTEIKKAEQLFTLSGLLSGWQDSNLRPPAPKAGAITGLRYTPKFFQLLCVWVAAAFPISGRNNRATLYPMDKTFYLAWPVDRAEKDPRRSSLLIKCPPSPKLWRAKAERQGFEPWRRLPVDRLAICSVTTPAPLQFL